MTQIQNCSRQVLTRFRTKLLVCLSMKNMLNEKNLKIIEVANRLAYYKEQYQYDYNEECDSQENSKTSEVQRKEF